jgi:hypothetical protein
VLLPAAGGWPDGEGGEGVHGEDAVFRGDPQAVEEAVGVGEAGGGVAADDPRDMGAVAAVRTVGAGRSARVAAVRDAGEAEAAHDMAAEIGVVIVHPCIHHRPDDTAAIDAEAGEVAQVAGDGHAAGVVAGHDLVRDLVVQVRPRALVAQPQDRPEGGHRRQRPGVEADDGVVKGPVRLGRVDLQDLGPELREGP